MLNLKTYYKVLCGTPLKFRKGSIAGNALNFEFSLYESFLKVNKPEHNLSLLVRLAYAYTKQGMHKKALSTDLKIVGITPEDPVAHYNLACSYSNLEDVEKALLHLGIAIDKGYDDHREMKKDTDLEFLHTDPRFFDLIERIKRAKKENK